MNDDYLWDRSGPVVEDVERLENALRPLRHAGGPPPRRRFATRRAAAAAAAAVIILAGAWWLTRDDDATSAPRSGACYTVAGVSGCARAFVGEEIVADEGAEIEIGDIGRVTLDPGARIRVDAADADDHRLFLVEGAVEASIGLGGVNRFRIGSPAGVSVDLGCEYRMDVDAAGTTHVLVRLGRVAFEAEGRRVIVPAGAECRTRPGRRPSTPLWTLHTTPRYREALAEIDASQSPPDDAVAIVLDVHEPRDTLVLWHLLQLPSAALRRAALARIRKLVTLPADFARVDAASVRAGALDALGEALHPYWLD